MIFPKSYKEILNLLNKIPEDIHMEYKGGQALDFSKVAEMSKDVSAFANSDGGVLIYGIQEDKSTHLPVSIDGVDSKKYSHEWLENVIKSNINPIIPDYEIKPIKIKGKPNLVIYSILIRKSYRAPHQAKDKKYYKRYNFKSEAMENYEIDDIRNRLNVVPPLIDIKVTIQSNMVAYLEISNIGTETAEAIKFNFPHELNSWIEETNIKPLREGIKFLAPYEKRFFWLGVSHVVLADNSRFPKQFQIDVTYFYPSLSQNINECFHVDLSSYASSVPVKSDIYTQGEKIEKALKGLTKEISKINFNLSRLINISGNSGLDLSMRTLKNINNILKNQQLERLDPTDKNYLLFKELLDVDIDLAINLAHFFDDNNNPEGLRKIEGINEEIIEKIKAHFILNGEIT